MGLKLATTYILIAALAVIAVIVFAGRSRPVDPEPAPAAVRGDELEVWPFEPMPFMTNSEVRFFARLQEALPEHFIFAQVQLSRLVQATDQADQKFWFNRICRMSADYVVVHRDAQRILAVIELDDWTHDRPDRRRADAKKDKAIQSAGLPMVRFDGRNMPEVMHLRRELLKAMHDAGTWQQSKKR
jgi:very-short-patch-repair endonuclease